MRGPRTFALLAGLLALEASAKVVRVHEKADVVIDADGSMQKGSAPRRAATNVDLSGWFYPTSFHWSPDGSKVYVAEKNGVVWRMNSFAGTKADAVQVLDIQDRAYFYGDHGLTSIWIDVTGAPYMYVTYQMEDPARPGLELTCTDDGQFDGRTMDQMNGCPSFGRFSRFLLNDAGDVIGPEEILMDGHQIITVNGESTYTMCTQFSTHSTTSIAQDPNTGNIYYSSGDGAAFTNCDYGTMGAANPCMDRAAYRGAFRALDPVRVNGKIMQFNPNTMQTRVYSSGHRNPWRIHWDVYSNRLLEAETGWFTYEEINVIVDGGNYGWPCFEGPDLSPQYHDADENGVPFHGNAACQALLTNNNWIRPAYGYAHPKPPPPGEVMSVSAVAADPGGVLYGDFTLMTIARTDANGADEVNARDLYICELRVLPDGTVAYVDLERGYIGTLDTGVIASPSNSPAAARAWVESTPNTWTPGSGETLTLTAKSTVNGREGLFFTFAVKLRSCDAATPNECTEEDVQVNVQSPVATFTAPATAGTLHVNVVANSHGGFVLPAAPFLWPAEGSTTCTCGVEIPDEGTSGQSSIFSSPAVLGGIIAAAVVVGLGAIILVAWYTGAAQRLGITGGGAAAHAAERRPAAAREAAAHAEHNGSSNIAARRGVPNPSLQPDAASAPSNPMTPAVGPTPKGGRKV